MSTTTTTDPQIEAIDAIRAVAKRAMLERDQLMRAVAKDDLDVELQRRLEDFNNGIGEETCCPAGAVALLLDNFHPRTGWGAFAAAYQRARGAAWRADMYWPSEVRELADAHRRLCDAARLRWEDEPNDWDDALEAHAPATMGVIDLVRFNPPTTVAAEPTDQQPTTAKRWRDPSKPTHVASRKTVTGWFLLKDERTLERWADDGTIALKRLGKGKWIACMVDIERVNQVALVDASPE